MLSDMDTAQLHPIAEDKVDHGENQILGSVWASASRGCCGLSLRPAADPSWEPPSRPRLEPSAPGHGDQKLRPYTSSGRHRTAPPRSTPSQAQLSRQGSESGPGMRLGQPRGGGW